MSIDSNLTRQIDLPRAMERQSLYLGAQGFGQDENITNDGILWNDDFILGTDSCGNTTDDQPRVNDCLSTLNSCPCFFRALLFKQHEDHFVGLRQSISGFTLNPWRINGMIVSRSFSVILLLVLKSMSMLSTSTAPMA